MIEVFVHPWMILPSLMGTSTQVFDIAKRGQIFASDIEGLAEDIVFEISKFPNMAPSPLTPWMETGHICLIIRFWG